jgi:hypothetical protein
MKSIRFIRAYRCPSGREFAPGEVVRWPEALVEHHLAIGLVELVREAADADVKRARKRGGHADGSHAA